MTEIYGMTDETFKLHCSFNQTPNARLRIEYYEFLGGGQHIEITGAKLTGIHPEKPDVVELSVETLGVDMSLSLTKADVKAMAMALNLIR